MNEQYIIVHFSYLMIQYPIMTSLQGHIHFIIDDNNIPVNIA